MDGLRTCRSSWTYALSEKNELARSPARTLVLIKGNDTSTQTPNLSRDSTPAPALSFAFTPAFPVSMTRYTNKDL